MKKKILYIAAIIICLSIIGGGTFAYYTATDTARNVITSDGIDIAVVEQQLVDGELQPYPDEPIKVMPATTVSKIVSVANLERSAWIRAKYTVSFFDAFGQKMDLSEEEIAVLLSIEPNTDAWTYSDGWWYHSEAVDTGETTGPLFESVSFAGPEMGNEYQNTTVEIEVTAQAVQEANNGETVLEALGWPAEEAEE